MSCPVKPRKRINPGRSKNGCLTCREKRKKCDERQPICARCERLRLVCQPCDRDTRPSLKERRRGRGSYKALNHSSWTAPPLLPAPSVSGILSRSSTPSVTLSNFSLPTTSIPEGLASEQDQHDEGTHMMYPTASDLGHPLGGGIMPFSLPFDSSSSSSSIFESCSGEASVDHHRGSNLDLILPQHIPLDDDGDYSTVIGPVSTPDRHNIIQSLFQSISQIPTNPFTFHTLASGVVLTKRDHHALVHYQTVFAHTQTLKNPKWSFPSLLLQTTSHSSMSFHMALAVSHQDFGLHNSSPAAQGCREDASFHFSVGLQSFQATMADAHTYSDQIAIMTTLYYMYIYLTNQEPRDAKKIARLSQVTLNYVIKYSLDFNLESGSPPASLQGGLANRPTDPATKALLARLLFWLYKEDVWSGFLGCGGRLASYFRMSQNKIKDIWKTSKSVLELNWGSSYPNDETVIDMEFSDVVDMNVYCVELQHQITEYYRAVVVDTGLREFRRLEESLNALETRYSHNFQFSRSPNTKNCFRYESAVIFWTLRIYHWRSLHPFGTARSPQVSEALRCVFRTAFDIVCGAGSLSSWNFLQWAIYIVGLETDDLIHREWILSKIRSLKVRNALEKALHAKSVDGILDMDSAGRMFCF